MTSLSMITNELIRVTGNQAIQAQLADWEQRGAKVKAYRNYYDGDHPANMTPEMRKLLRVAMSASGSDEFNDNYMAVVVDTMADRLNLLSVEADNDPATEWAEQVLEANNIDALQMDSHEAAIRDGETYLMPQWDNDDRRVVFTQELAYDGTSGVLALYKSADLNEMTAAVKVWVLTAEGSAVVDTVRVNVYLPDRIIKYISKDGSTLARYQDESTDENGEAAWVDRAGAPLGIPIIPLRNKGRQNQGLSELENAIPLQNALNRVLHSIVMTSELSAFQIKYIIGAPSPGAVTPGMFVQIGENGITPEQASAIKLGQWDAGDMSQQLNVARWIKSEIGTNTRTPAPEFMGGDNASGEALKQREIGLIGKVKRFMVKAGNSWCQLMDMAWNIQAAYGDQPPDYERFKAKWADAEIRNDQITIDNAIKVKDAVGEREFLRLISAVYPQYDEATIDKLMAEKANDNGARVAAMAAQLPSYANAQYDLSGMADQGARMMQAVGNGNGNGAQPPQVEAGQ